MSITQSPAQSQDHTWMQLALQQAQNALANNEVPIGAVLVGHEQSADGQQGTAIGLGWNQCITACDPTAHAEIVALRNAASQRQNYRLPATTLYVTIEPCSMCLGALVHARVGRLVFGAKEPKGGCLLSNTALLDSNHFNHNFEFVGGVLEEQCGQLMRQFFADRR